LILENAWSFNGLNGNIIELPESCLTKPRRVDCAIIGAVMLWPGNPAARQSEIHTSSVEYLKTNPVLRDAVLGSDAFEFAAQAKPLEDLKGVVNSPLSHGCMVGAVCYNVIVAKLGNAEISTSEAVKRFESDYANLNKMRSVLGISGQGKKHFYNEIWPTFRPVAHFWAAFFWYSKKFGNPTFPCEMIRIAEFLGQAEALLTLGETTKPPKSSRTLLARADAYQLPFSVPKIEFHFDKF
jgi:hypothetical protein